MVTPRESMVWLGKIAYEAFFKKLNIRPQLEWDKQDHDVQDAWEAAALAATEESFRLNKPEAK